MSFLQDYKICTDNNEAPATYHLFAGLVAISSLVSGKVWLDMGLFAIRPNLYVILTGPPGIKKTTAMVIAKQLLREVGPNIAPMTAECQSKEDLTQMMASKARVCQLKPGQVPKRFSPIDEERSKYVYCPISSFVTEFSQFVGTSSAAHMLDFLTTIYDEHEYTASTKNKGTDKMPMPYFCLLGCTVPDWLTNRLKDDVISGGFSRRAIFVYESEPRGRFAFPVVTPEMSEAWERVVAQAKRIATIKGPYTWGPGSREYYEQWYNNLVKPTDPLLDGWFNSVQIQMLKIAMLISASEWDGTSQHSIEITHMQMSIELLRIVEINIPKVFKGIGRNELYGISNKIIELLSNSPNQQLPERFIKRELFREANIDEITKILTHLLAIRRISRITDTLRPGAPQEAFIKLLPQ